MRTDPGHILGGRQRITIACLGTALAVVGVVGAVIMLRSNDLSAAHGGSSAAVSGDVFPDTTIHDADGATVATSSLAGKPTLVWFSDSLCPDLDGVARVARLDDETGGDALQILMVFINQPADPVAREWRDAFGRPDWLVASDRGAAVSAKLVIRTPETKILLDQHARMVDTDTGLIDDAYLSMLQQRVRR